MLSALVFGGRLGWLRQCWQRGAIRPVVCRDTAMELARVLAYPKFRLVRAEQDALLADYLPCCETFVLPDPPPDVPNCEDRDDLVFLRLAVASDVVALVRGDAHIAALRGRLAVPVLSAAELQTRLAV